MRARDIPGGMTRIPAAGPPRFPAAGRGFAAAAGGRAKQVARGQGKFALAALKPEIMSVFKVSGLTSVLKIFDTADGALASFGAS